MKNLLMTLLVCAAAANAFGDDRIYSFAITRDEHGKDAIRFADAVGAHWKWLALGCGPQHPGCEMRVNDRGGSMSDPADPVKEGRNGFPDVGFVQIDDGTIRGRCLAKSCTLKSGEVESQTIEVPIGARVEVRVK